MLHQEIVVSQASNGIVVQELLKRWSDLKTGGDLFRDVL